MGQSVDNGHNGQPEISDDERLRMMQSRESHHMPDDVGREKAPFPPCLMFPLIKQQV